MTSSLRGMGGGVPKDDIMFSIFCKNVPFLRFKKKFYLFLCIAEKLPFSVYLRFTDEGYLFCDLQKKVYLFCGFQKKGFLSFANKVSFFGNVRYRQNMTDDIWWGVQR